jgi:hypothetical protein
LVFADAVWPSRQLTFTTAIIYRRIMNRQAPAMSLVRSARASWWRWLVPPAGAPAFDR